MSRERPGPQHDRRSGKDSPDAVGSEEAAFCDVCIAATLKIAAFCDVQFAVTRISTN